MDYKKRVANAINRYSDKQAKKLEPKVARKNRKPEQESVFECLSWLKRNGFDCDIIESKATFSVKAGRYLRSQAVAGMSDLVGNDKDGRACFIEIKAKGRRSTLKEHQFEFLARKIKSNCFATVATGEDELEEIYSRFLECLNLNQSHAQEYLLSQLPGHQSPGTAPDVDDLPW